MTSLLLRGLAAKIGGLEPVFDVLYQLELPINLDLTTLADQKLLVRELAACIWEPQNIRALCVQYNQWINLYNGRQPEPAATLPHIILKDSVFFDKDQSGTVFHEFVVSVLWLNALKTACQPAPLNLRLPHTYRLFRLIQHQLEWPSDGFIFPSRVRRVQGANVIDTPV